MHALADTGSHIDNGAFAVFIAIAAAAWFGAWVRGHYDRNRYVTPSCVNCRTRMDDRWCDACNTRGAQRILNAIHELDREET